MWTFIEAPLDLDDVEVLLDFLDGDGLVGLRALCVQRIAVLF